MASAEPIQPAGVLIVGTGTLAIWAAELLEASGIFVYGFTPTQASEARAQDDLPILPPITRARIWKLIARREADYVIALGDPTKRAKMAHQLFERAKWPARNAIHPMTFIAKTASISGGSFLLPFVAIGPHAQIGGYVVLEAGATIGPNVQIADFVNVGSGAQIGENCKIDSYALIGRGAVLLPNVHIGKGAQVLPGSVVSESVAPGQTVGGNPACPL